MIESQYYGHFTGKSSFPVPVSLQGLISTNGDMVTISGANSGTPIQENDYIYEETNNEVRKVVQLTSTGVKIEFPFSSDVTNKFLFITERVRYESVSVMNHGYVDGILKGATFPQRFAVLYRIDENDAPLVPFTLDATGTRITISATI